MKQKIDIDDWNIHLTISARFNEIEKKTFNLANICFAHKNKK